MKIQLNQADLQTIVDIPAEEIPVILREFYRPEQPKTKVELAPLRCRDCALTDWNRVAEICRNGDAARHFEIGQMLSLYSPVWGFIEWEIARMEKDGFWLIARRPVCAMPFDAPELDRNGDRENIDGRDDWGSNNPLHCAPHKFLNSDAPAGKWWKASTDFDQPPEEHEQLPGFLSGLPQAFLDCVKITEVEMEIPECDGGGTEKQPLRFFLPSRQELFPDGNRKPFFKLKTLRKDGCIWFLRSPYVGNSYIVYFVISSGALNYSNANSAYGCVPACRIG